MARKVKRQAEDEDTNGARRQSLKYAGDVSVEATSAYLDALARALRDGSVQVGYGDKSLVLPVAKTVSFEIRGKLSGKKAKSSVEISLRWNDSTDEAPDSPLAIESGRDLDFEDGAHSTHWQS